MIFQKIISASLSPNSSPEYVLLALKLLLKPWLWQDGEAIAKVKNWFKSIYPSYEIYTFNSGRSAEFEILKAFGIKSGDEVIVQAFTCVAVPNSVLWTGATPVYVDIEDSLNINPVILEEKISSKTKAIIVQHTFGSPAQINKILTIAKRKNILVIEDCAHSLNVAINQKLLGSFGDAAFFSFGRDKVISSVFGGVGIINIKHKKAIDLMNRQYKQINKSRILWIFQQLFHPLAFAFILPLYNLVLGKLILVLLQKLHCLSFPVYSEEKYAKRPADFPALLPNALATLAMQQLNNLSKLTAIRKQMQTRYEIELQNIKEIKLPYLSGDTVYLRFPIIVKSPKLLHEYAKKQGVILGNWYSNAIDPAGVDFSALKFNKKDAPKAVELVKYMVNLPTLISEFQANKVIKMLKSYFQG